MMSENAHELRPGGNARKLPSRSAKPSKKLDDAELVDENYKIQIKLNSKQKERLFQLRAQTGVESAAQVVRDALRVYEFLVEEVADGTSDVFVQDRDSGEVCKVKLL